MNRSTGNSKSGAPTSGGAAATATTSIQEPREEHWSELWQSPQPANTTRKPTKKRKSIGTPVRFATKAGTAVDMRTDLIVVDGAETSTEADVDTPIPLVIMETISDIAERYASDIQNGVMSADDNFLQPEGYMRATGEHLDTDRTGHAVIRTITRQQDLIQLMQLAVDVISTSFDSCVALTRSILATAASLNEASSSSFLTGGPPSHYSFQALSQTFAAIALGADKHSNGVGAGLLSGSSEVLRNDPSATESSSWDTGEILATLRGLATSNTRASAAPVRLAATLGVNGTDRAELQSLLDELHEEIQSEAQLEMHSGDIKQINQVYLPNIPISTNKKMS